MAASKEPCDRVDCSTDVFRSKINAEFVLLPCHVPYAVQISTSRDGKVVLNKTVDHSQEIDIPELLNMKLNIILNQYPDAIELKVYSYNFVVQKHFKSCNATNTSKLQCDV